MFKNCISKLFLLVLPLSIAFTATNGFAVNSHLSPIYIELSTSKDPHFGKPFVIFASGYLPTSSNALLHTTLSDNFQLLWGDLYSYTHFYKIKSACSQVLIVQISKPGIYEVSVSFHATEFRDKGFNVLPGGYAKLVPRYSHLYFYAREDTIAVYWDRKLMEQCIRDTLIIPLGQIYARRDAQVRAKHYAEHPEALEQLRLYERMFQPAKLPLQMVNGHPDIIGIWPCDLMYGNPPKWIHDYGYVQHGIPVTDNGYPLTVLCDSIFQTNLLDRFTMEKIHLIANYHLLLSPPRSDCETLLLNDTITNPEYKKLTLEQQTRLAQIGKQQLNELYEFDKRVINNPHIVYTSNPGFKEFYTERRELIGKHIEEVALLRHQIIHQ